jgi:hypothetical protein
VVVVVVMMMLMTVMSYKACFYTALALMKLCTNVICKNVEKYEMACPWFETLQYVLLCMRNIVPVCLPVVPGSLVIMVKNNVFCGVYLCVFSYWHFLTRDCNQDI